MNPSRFKGRRSYSRTAAFARQRRLLVLTLLVFVILAAILSRNLWLLGVAVGFALCWFIRAIEAAEAEAIELRTAATTARDFTASLLQNASTPIFIADGGGILVSANPAAQALLGSEAVRSGEAPADWATRHALRYPSGQPIPPGAIPLTRAILDCRSTESAEFLLSTGQATRLVELTAVPLLSADKNCCLGAVVILNDVTDLRHSQEQAAVIQAYIAVLARISGQIAAATSNELVTQIITDAAVRLVPSQSGDIRAAWFNLEDKCLVLLGESPQRPRTRQQKKPLDWPFDVQLPLVWQLYVGRQFVCSADVTLDARFDDQNVRPLLSLIEGNAAKSLLAVPLTIGKQVRGHLVVTSSQPGALDAPSLHDAMSILAALAVFARANASLNRQTRQNAVELETLWTTSQAVVARQNHEEFTRSFTEQVRSALRADVCLISLWDTGFEGEHRLCHQESGLEDALLPGQALSESPSGCIGCDNLCEQAVRNGTVMRAGIPNPAFGDCRWCAFAGQSGVHSILASPIRRGGEVLGVVTLFRSGGSPFTPSQIHLLETFAVLFAAEMQWR